MKECGIISEYNPFHNGHRYQTDILKSKYPDITVVSLMSPNFVQRGECAIFDKYARAEAAVKAGVDLVLSIPLVFSVLSAEGYAEAGVSLASALGLDAISFGAECDDTGVLFEIADFMLSEEYKKSTEALCTSSPSLSLMRAGEKAVLLSLGERCAEAVSKPNNILALEYIKAIKRYAPTLETIIIKRKGAGYKSLETSPFPSAMLIRDKIAKGESLDGLVPDSCNEVYTRCLLQGEYIDREKFLSHLHFTLLQRSDDELCDYIGSVELAHRIKEAINNSNNLEEAVSKAITTRFTRARIMRAVISALLKIPHNAFMHKAPSYTQLLAFGEKGREFLASRRKDSFPIITKNADTSEYEKDAEFTSQWSAECLADSLWSLGCYKPRSANFFLKRSPFVLK